MANINGSEIIDSLPIIFNESAEDGATFAVKLDLSGYSNESWDSKTINDSSTALQKITWKSVEGSTVSASLYASPEIYLTEFSFSSSDKVGTASKIISTFKGAETFSEKDTATSYTSTGTYSGTLNYKDLGTSTTSSDDIVYFATKTVTETDAFNKANNTGNLKEKATYSYSAIEGGYSLSITSGVSTFNELYDYSDGFTGTFNGTESHKYSLTNNNPAGGKITFTGGFSYSGNYSGSFNNADITSATYTFTDLVVENSVLKISTKSLVNTDATLDVGISSFAGLDPSLQSNPNVDEIYSGLFSLLANQQLTQANVVTLKVGQSFSAGAGNDTVTGSSGDDIIDGGEGDDALNAGVGNDVLIWSGFGKDTYDGGAHIVGDTLYLNDFGDGNGSSYDLFTRGNSTYVVTGTAANFTITNKAPNGGTLAAKGIEFVTIGGETVSVEKFLSPNVTFITGLDLLSSENDYTNLGSNIPSVNGFKNASSYVAGQLVDLGEMLSQDWLQEKSFNPDAASNNVSFTNADKSTISAKTSKTVDTLTANVTAKSGDNAQNFIGDLKTTTKSAVTGSGVNQTITTTTINGTSFTFKDTRGTTDISDDVLSSLTQAQKIVVTENSNSKNIVFENAIKQSYSVDIYKLSIDHVFKDNSIEVAGLVTSSFTNEIKSYTYSDAYFSLSFNGTLTGTAIDGVLLTNNTSLNNVSWNDYDLSFKTASFSSSTLGQLNLGYQMSGDITTVDQDMKSQLLPELLSADNVITLKSFFVAQYDQQTPLSMQDQNAGFHAGAGNDKVTGTKFNDLIFGDAGNDTLIGGLGNDILVGGKGVDKLSGGFGSDKFVFDFGDVDWNSDANGLTTPKVDQILDYQKGVDYISLGLSTPHILATQEFTAVDANHALINASGMATFAAGSGKTMKDAVNDVENSLSGAGQYAFFKVNNVGNYYMFISDGQQGVTDTDIVVQLVGINSINGVNGQASDQIQIF